MFFAQWSNNYHHIATILKTGTTGSRIILSLFDCGFNAEHTHLCDATGMTHYPTLTYIGAGPYP